MPGSFGTAGAAKAADKGSGQGQKARESGQGQKARESGQGQKARESGQGQEAPLQAGDAAGQERSAKTAKIGSLAAARAAGARIQVVYAPQDAVAYAKEHPQEQVVFLSVGFETTTPSSCLAVKEAMSEGLTNFSILTANKTMPAAYAAMKDSTDAFLYPGHVHAITGTGICEELAREGTGGAGGFTAKELMTALAVIVKKTQEGKP